MRNMSEKFRKSLRTNHLVYSRIEVINNDTVVLNSASQPKMYVTEGEVTMDRGANFRRSLTLELADPDRTYLPGSPASGYFHPLAGYEIKPYRGILFDDGSIEEFSQGVFGIADCDIRDDFGDASLVISGFDRSRRVHRATLTRPYKILNNTNTVTAIKDLINFCLGFTPVYLETSTTYTTNYTIYEVGTDPWDAITKLAESIGYEVFFNADGACVIRPVPDPNTGAVSFSYAEGSEAIIGGLSKNLSNETAYNGVLATGQSAYNITPAFGEAWDTDPSSPTYSGYDPATKTFPNASRYGRHPKILEPNPNIKTNDQARAAAAAQLLSVKGAAENIEFVSVVNPAHEESDLISITRAEIAVNAVYILDRFNIPLTAKQGMTAKTRERRV